MHRRGTRAGVVVLMGLVVAAPAPAHPPAPVDQSGRPIGGRVHVWVHEAKVPLIHGRIVIRRTLCPANPLFAGCIYTSRPRTLYLHPHAREPRRNLYHELGHSFDLLVLNSRERVLFKRIVGIRISGWWHAALPPAEWFADAYSVCALRSRLRARGRATPYGYAPTPREHARVCRLIRSAAAPHGRRPTRPKDPPPVMVVQPPPEQTQPGDCTLVDQLLTGCTPPPPPSPPSPVPVG